MRRSPLCWLLMLSSLHKQGVRHALKVSISSDICTNEADTTQALGKCVSLNAL